MSKARDKELLTETLTLVQDQVFSVRDVINDAVDEGNQPATPAARADYENRVRVLRSIRLVSLLAAGRVDDLRQQARAAALAPGRPFDPVADEFKVQRRAAREADRLVRQIVASTGEARDPGAVTLSWLIHSQSPNRWLAYLDAINDGVPWVGWPLAPAPK